MKINIGSLILIAAILINLSGCNYVKGLFPDKEKDYQFTTEIAPLVLPPDLSDKPDIKQSDVSATPAIEAGKTEVMQADTIQDVDTGAVEQSDASFEKSTDVGSPLEPETTALEQKQSESVTQKAEAAAEGLQAGSPSELETVAVEHAPEDSETAAAVPAQAPDKQKTRKTDEVSIKLVVYADGETRLRFGADAVKAWRMVGKALSRKSIEVISRSQEEASYEVLYDPDEQPVKDGSLWNEVKFFFGGFNVNEKQYLLKCIGNNEQTEVAVLDPDGNPAMNGAGLRLLRLIQTTLEADQSD